MSPFTASLNHGPGTYYYRVRARMLFGLSAYSEVRTAVVGAPAPRRVMIRNEITAGLNLQQVVQVKIVSPTSSFRRADLLTDDALNVRPSRVRPSTADNRGP